MPYTTVRQLAVRIDLNQETAPDATTLLKFRHLLEEHHLTESIFTAINVHLTERELFLREGTIVDATLIAARLLQPGIRKKTRYQDASNQERQQWHFGMKVQIGVDAQSRLVHTLIGTGCQCSRRYSGTGTAAW
ncbi:MAG: transposase [Nitrosomonas sp.]|nr:transposase [Nitrosomonas sp.]